MSLLSRLRGRLRLGTRLGLRDRPSPPGLVSYSQVGEDLIAAHALRELGIEKPSYLDIGAHHPVELSNTYLFYLRGGRGVLVEPDPARHSLFRAVRPEDTLLGVGVAAESGEADFYVMSSPTLNTFSKKEAEYAISTGEHRIEQVVRLPVVGINELLERHGRPNLVSVDVEGLDFEILRAWDFEGFRPEVLIVETGTYTLVRGGERQREEIFELMEAAGYFRYGLTWINSVFVDWRVWDLRGPGAQGD